MKVFVLMVALLTATAEVQAANVPDFSGRWSFDAGKSQNIASMAGAAITSTVAQTSATLTVDNHSIFGGRTIDDHTVYDLTGAPAQNASPMSGTGMTLSRWQSGTLVTEWDSAGAVPGATTKRFETRTLSPDGQTMFIESERAGRPAIVMAFDRVQ